MSKHVAFSCGSKLVYDYYNFSRPFKSCLGKDTACNFINSMIEEGKYCIDIMKKTF